VSDRLSPKGVSPRGAHEIDPDRELEHPDGLLRFLDDPVTALVPWFAFSFLLTTLGFMTTAWLAFGLSLTLVVASRLRGEDPKTFEISDTVLFAGIVLVAFIGDGAMEEWLSNHADAVSNITLTLVAFLSLAIGRPFTSEYTAARFQGAPPDLLVRLDRLATPIWGFALLFASIVTVFGEWVLRDPTNLWTGWILQTLPLIVALDLTLWIDRRAVARARNRPDLIPPPVMLARDLLIWLVPAGMCSLVFDGGPQWLGWTLVVVGLVSCVWAWIRLRREAPAIA
jgi:hypothetical protein